MNIFDCNTNIGHWPFRSVTEQNAPELASLLAKHHITHAAVGNINSLFYRNCHAGNRELAEALKPFAGILYGVGTINPEYPGFDRDFCECVEKLNFRFLKLAPAYHAYTLGKESANLTKLMKLAAEYKIPVIIPACVENFRQRHHLDVELPLDPAEVIVFAAKHPENVFIFTEGNPPPEQLSNAPRNLYIELSRYRSAYGDILGAVIQTIGAERVVFGSGAPYKEILPAQLKVNSVDSLAEADKRKILFENIHSFIA